jgi:hypothetical protein
MNLSLTIPLHERSTDGFRSSDVAAHRANADRFKSRYGDLLEQTCAINNVPESLQLALLMVENEQGKTDSVSSAGAIGLAQIKPMVAADMIYTANRRKLLSDDKKTVLRQTLGVTLDSLLRVADSGEFRQAVWQNRMRSALLEPRFNLMVSGLITGMFVADHGLSGQLRYDYVALRYNQGYYVLSANDINKSLTPLGLYTAVGDNLKPTNRREAQAYLIRVCGAYGWLDILTQ